MTTRASSSAMAAGGPAAYREFDLLHENAAELGLPGEALPRGRRIFQEGPATTISAIRWGSDAPKILLLHGGGQNAHTWDSLIVRLGMDWPALAVDLPGHGHSGGAVSTDAESLARQVTPIVDANVEEPVLLCGMSLGGLVATAFAGARPKLITALVLVDVLPGVEGASARRALDAMNGPSTFDSFEALVEVAAAAFPDRSRTELQRGILHNAEQQPDGSWRWRYRRPEVTAASWDVADTSPLWHHLEECAVPILLVRGTRPTSVLEPRHDDEIVRHVASARVAHCDAGHNVQSEATDCLARHIEEFATTLGSTG